MTDQILRALKLVVDFGKTSYGLIHTPYQTVRSIALRPDKRHLVFVAILVAMYLVSATIVRGGLRASPLFLSASLSKVAVGVFLTYFSTIVFITYIGKFFGQAYQATLQNIAVLWGYTLIPTVLWFLTMSISFYLLPPPRTASLSGQLASAFFIALSTGLFFWKVILYYLTLRFGLRLSLRQIFLFSSLFAPSAGLYAVVMYRIGIFRIPFI